MNGMETFEALAGNPHIKDYFSRAFAGEKIPHALLLTGEAGSGKTMVARAFAARLQCEHPQGLSACGMCRSCKQMAGGNHPDVITVEHEKPRSFGVEDIRGGLVNDMTIRPYASRYKVYLLDLGDLTITPEAQNAMLKTLEEPPSYGVLVIMTRNAEALLDTIRSRCVQLGMQPVPDETVRAMLAGKITTGADEDVIVSLARGNVGRALKLAASEDVAEVIAETLAALKNIRRMRADEMQAFTAGLKEKRDAVPEAFSIARFWYRDCLCLKADENAPIVLEKERRAIAAEAAERPAAELAGVFDAIGEAEARLAGNVTFEVAMEVLLMAMRGRGERTLWQK